MVNIIETANRPELQTGVSSGIQSIDHHTGGLDKEQLWVVAAPSSCGKTMLMMQVAQSFLNQGKSVLAYSFETSAGKLGIRSLANGMSIRGNALLARQGEKLTKSDIGRIRTGISEMNQANNLAICDNYDLTLDSMMASAAQRKKLGFDIDLIVVDYIQLVSVMGQGKSREQEVAEISRGLKKMAKQHGCPVITASQLNEEGRTRESRAIVNDADVLLAIDPEEETVEIQKNREGERFVRLNLRMNGQYQRFEEYN
jgi:replicative DNA helicase